MEEKNMQQIMAKAEVLIEALPYIQRFKPENYRCQVRWKCHD